MPLPSFTFPALPLRLPAHPATKRRVRRPPHLCTKPPNRGGAGPPARRPTNWQSRDTLPSPPARRPTEDQTVARITACARRGDWYAARSAWQLYTSSRAASARLLGAYVHALCRASRVAEAVETLGQHPALDGPVARTSVISALARAGRPDEALRELRWCRGRGMEMRAPNAYTAVLHALGVAGRAEDAARVLGEAEREGVRVDVEMYDAVIRAYGRVGRVSDAFGVLAVVRARGLRPTDCTFEGLIYGCAHAGEGQGLGRRAFVIYEAAKAEGRASARVTGAVASAVLRAALVRDARTRMVVGEMREIWEREGEQGLADMGVDPVRFRLKLRDLERLCAKADGSERERGAAEWTA